MKRILAIIAATVIMLVGGASAAMASGPSDHDPGNRWYCNSVKSPRYYNVGLEVPHGDHTNDLVLTPGECASTGSTDPSLIVASGKSYRISYGHGYGKCKPGAAWWNPSKKHDFIVIKNYSANKCKNA
jgi:hypothetical protein